MKYYSALKKKETLSFATPWLGLEDVMLSGASKAEKDKCHRSHLYVDSKTVLNSYMKGHTSGC